MERTAPASLNDLLVDRGRLFTRLIGEYRNVGVDLWIDPIDPAEHVLDEFTRRELAPRDKLRGFVVSHLS